MEKDPGNFCICVSRSLLGNADTSGCRPSFITARNVIFLMKIKCFGCTK